MSDFIQSLLGIVAQITTFITPIFVFIVCFNSGMSQHPKKVLKTANENIGYYSRVILASNIIYPLFVWGLMTILPFPEFFKLGALVFFICAGAPIVISFTQSAGNTGLYATAGMIIQLIASIIIIPVLLPLMVGGVEIDMGILIWNLIKTVVIPLILGFIIAIYWEELIPRIRPTVGKFQKVTMDIVIYGTLIRNIPNIIDLIGEFAILTGVILVYLAFYFGYWVERKNPNTAMRETTAFSVGQRNFAIASVIAMTNFPPEVMLATVIVYAIGLLQMRHLTTVLKRQKSALSTAEEFSVSQVKV